MKKKLRKLDVIPKNIKGLTKVNLFSIFNYMTRFQEKIDKLLAKENFSKSFSNDYYVYRKYNDITIGIHDTYIDFYQTIENSKRVPVKSIMINYAKGKKLILRLIPEIHKCKTYDRLAAKYENLYNEILLDKLL